ncbi:hypothetical protein ACHAXT_010519 [Thalassiosira profunda]
MGTPDQLSFDVIVVGAGPSAAGLLRGLLLQILEGRDVRIAVLERGGASETSHDVSVAHQPAASGKDAPNEEPRRFRHPHPSTHSLREWFTAAHYTSRASNHMNTSDADASHALQTDDATAPPTVLHTTTPQPHLHQRILDVPTGSGWGGTTNIHAGLVMEPNYERDFDAWPGRWRGGAVMKDAVKEVMGALKEEGALSVGSLTGTDGKLDCGNDAEKCRSFVEVFSEGNACSAEALDLCGKFHKAATASTTAAASSHDDAATPATRVNYFTALVGPLLQKHPELESNVTFLSGMQAERVLVGAEGDQPESGDASVEEYRAYAVECLVSNGAASSGRRRVLIHSTREIVLCTGAIGSPALLLASGIGHEDDLKKAGIAPWYDRLEDQCNIPQSAIFDLPLIRGWTRLHTASVNVCLLTPQSTGKMTVLRSAKSASPARLSECQVSIDPGYLSDSRDMEALWAGWNVSDAIKQRWFGGCIEILPGVVVISIFSALSYLCSMLRWLVWPTWDGSAEAKDQREDRPAWFDGYAADFTNPYYHWCGTCAMGEELAEDRSDASSFVVDEQLCVQGIAGLRVCDASVFPCCVSAPTALTCAGLGYAASSLIGEKA